MAFLKTLAPIVRGQCDACGDSRNLWVSELGGEDVPCGHGDRGCRGYYRVVYTGPKAFLPRELEHVNCTCGRGRGDARGTLATLLEMGFPEAAAREAAERCGSVDAAVELLTAAGAPVACGSGAAASSSAAASAGAGAAALCLPCGGAGEMIEGECAICTEDLLLADAAMRCTGEGGKRHYFHAHCLTAWVRQCRSGGLAPTCPECRGPVQVRPRRLEEFMQEKGSKLDAEDQEAMRTFTAGAQGNPDDLGWSNLREDLWKAGALLAIGAGVALAIGLGVHALTSGRKQDRRED